LSTPVFPASRTCTGDLRLFTKGKTAGRTHFIIYIKGDSFLSGDRLTKEKMVFMTRAIVYTAPECPHSKNLKQFLTEIGVDFEEKCVLTSPEIFAELKEVSGQLAIPVLVIEGESFVGFDRRAERRIKRRLGV
jgi:glutaredoxin